MVRDKLNSHDPTNRAILIVGMVTVTVIAGVFVMLRVLKNLLLADTVGMIVIFVVWLLLIPFMAVLSKRWFLNSQKMTIFRYLVLSYSLISLSLVVSGMYLVSIILSIISDFMYVGLLIYVVPCVYIPFRTYRIVIYNPRLNGMGSAIRYQSERILLDELISPNGKLKFGVYKYSEVIDSVGYDVEISLVRYDEKYPLFGNQGSFHPKDGSIELEWNSDSHATVYLSDVMSVLYTATAFGKVRYGDSSKYATVVIKEPPKS